MASDAERLCQALGCADADMAIVYDGDCVFCSAYVKLLRLREAVGRIELIDARDGDNAAKIAGAADYDLNEGMLVVYGGQVHHGADAMNILSLMSSESGTANRFMANVFKKKARARFLYPAMRAGRNLTLRLRGRKPIA